MSSKRVRRPEGIADHPAEYSFEVLEIIREIVPSGVRVLDHMAGTGWRLATTLDDCEVVGIELEPEWADAHPCVRQGNALHLPFEDGEFMWVVNSPVYGNRMSDHHDAKERCKACSGTGVAQGKTGLIPCEKCIGKGFRSYRRRTYKHTLGRDLHPDNAGQLHWRPIGSRDNRYREFHSRTNAEVWRVLGKGGTFVENVKNHYATVGPQGDRRQEEQPVAEWHMQDLIDRGFILMDKIEVKTPGMRHGQNREARVEHEYVLVFQKP